MLQEHDGIAGNRQAFAASARRSGALSRIWMITCTLFAEEREWGRLFLWVPVAFGAGILAFFAAPQNPDVLVSAALAAAAIGTAVLLRHQVLAGPLAAALALAVCGFTAATIRTELVKAPILERTARATVTGIVERLDVRTRGYRLLVTVENFESRAKVSKPKRMRIVVTRKGSEPPLGARISVAGLWRPPPSMARPDGYDWSRDAFFQQIGAVGAADSAPVVIDARPDLGPTASLNRWIAEARAAVAARIMSALKGAVGAIAASLVVGERGAIPESVNEDMRISGLAHVLSISGLHMALFAGAVFWTIRAACALWPRVVLRYPIKKWAAVAAIIAAYGYLLLAGAEVAAQRSFLMAAITFLAIALDRSALSLRSVAIAALILMVLSPEMVMSISFQMSFAAVLALIAAYDALKHWRSGRERADRSWIMHYVVIFVVAGIMTTLIAGLATAPFGAFYFQRSGVYSLLANLMAMPMISFIIMPAVVIGLALVPFGLDGFAWHVMGYGIEGMMWVAHFVAGLPGAAVYNAAFETSALLLMIMALIWLCLWKTPIRLLAAFPLAAGIGLAATSPRPDIYIDAEGRAMAIRHPDGDLRITGTRFARFAAASWLAADGDERDVSNRGVTSDVQCDASGCRLQMSEGRSAVLLWSYRALRSDCDKAALVVTRLVAPQACRDKTEVIDATDLAAHGSMSLLLTEDGFQRRSARETTADRYWFNRPKVRVPPMLARPSPANDDSAPEGAVSEEASRPISSDE